MILMAMTTQAQKEKTDCNFSRTYFLGVRINFSNDDIYTYMYRYIVQEKVHMYMYFDQKSSTLQDCFIKLWPSKMMDAIDGWTM